MERETAKMGQEVARESAPEGSSPPNVTSKGPHEVPGIRPATNQIFLKSRGIQTQGLPVSDFMLLTHIRKQRCTKTGPRSKCHYNLTIELVLLTR
jgi:hypothetical protein